jgi:F-type H+-transporting ATPase subunit delta
VTNRGAARRYARALFDVLRQESADAAVVERTQTELAGLADLLKTYPALAGAISNPAVPVAKKRAVMQALLDKGAVRGSVAKLVLLLADRDRLVLLPDLAAVYDERVLEWKNVVRGEVTTAVPMASENIRALERRLSQATGRSVTLDAKVDPSIVGGVITRLGSTVFDGSVTTQLQRLKETLLEGGQ